MHKIKGLSPKEKMVYLWDYYRYYLFGAIFLTFLFLYFMFPVIQNAGKHPILSIAIIDSTVSAKNSTVTLQDDILNTLAPLDTKAYILIDTAASSSEDSTDSVIKETMTLSSVSENDIVICSKDTYERYAAEGAFLNWESVLGASYTTYSQYIDGEIMYLDESSYWKTLGYTDYSPVYACILNQAPHTDNIKSFVSILYDNQ